MRTTQLVDEGSTGPAAHVPRGASWWRVPACGLFAVGGGMVVGRELARIARLPDIEVATMFAAANGALAIPVVVWAMRPPGRAMVRFVLLFLAPLLAVEACGRLGISFGWVMSWTLLLLAARWARRMGREDRDQGGRGAAR